MAKRSAEPMQGITTNHKAAHVWKLHEYTNNWGRAACHVSVENDATRYEMFTSQNTLDKQAQVIDSVHAAFVFGYEKVSNLSNAICKLQFLSASAPS